jgi:hypothetical protein
MIAAAARIPTATELEAHRRRVAFRASIAAKAAALNAPAVAAPEPAPVVVDIPPPPSPPAEPGSMKEPWFYVEHIAAKRSVSIREIQMVVCRHYGFTFEKLNAQRRTRPVVRARQVAFYLCRELTSQSLPVIGSRFGGKDHTTVLHGCRTIDALIAVDAIDAETGNARPNTKCDPNMAADVAKLRAELEALL